MGSNKIEFIERFFERVSQLGTDQEKFSEIENLIRESGLSDDERGELLAVRDIMFGINRLAEVGPTLHSIDESKWSEYLMKGVQSVAGIAVGRSFGLATGDALTNVSGSGSAAMIMDGSENQVSRDNCASGAGELIMFDIYLGDGVYASFDGMHIWLDLRAQDPRIRIALDGEVLKNLDDYRSSLSDRVRELNRDEE